MLTENMEVKDAYEELTEAIEYGLGAVGIDNLVEYLETETYGGEVTEMSICEQKIMDSFLNFINVVDIEYRKNDRRKTTLDKMLALSRETTKNIEALNKQIEEMMR